MGVVYDLGLEVVDEAVAVVQLARPEPSLDSGERLVAPLGEPSPGNGALSAECVSRRK
jgi:hypothetical protein